MEERKILVTLLARLGQIRSVALISVCAAIAAVAVTSGLILLLNAIGFDFELRLALPLALVISLAVTPLISWVPVGLTLRSLRLEKEMRDLASCDSLTGLLSRHAFIENAGRGISLANRHGAAFSVLIIDLDHLKKINDRYGHPAGDAVLKLFADVVNSVARRSDIIGRLGGEEFAMLLSGTDTEKALEFCERLHAEIARAVLKYQDSMIRYTVSIGLTAANQGQLESIENLLAHADLALYQAKKDGRNRTAVFNYATERVVAG